MAVIFGCHVFLFCKIYVKLTPIRQQNFMIKNKEFFVYSVGANCVRPLQFTIISGGRTQFAPTNNNHQIGVKLTQIR